MPAEKLEVLLEVDSTTGIAEIKRTGKALDDIGTTSETTGRRAGKAFDSLGGKVFHINELLDFSQRAFRMLSTPMEKIIDVGAKFETIQLQLSTILQSAEKGKEYFEWVRDFSARTPFRIEGLAEAVAMLESFGINSKKYLETFGDTASALQIPLGDLSRVMGQIWSKPTAQMEEMLQLIERGVPVAKILGDKLGLTADQIANIGRQGIRGKEVFEALASGMQELYGGAMKKFSGTWTGMISTLQDKVDLFLGRIAGPVMENLKGRLESLLAKIDQWAKDGTLEKVAKEIADFVGDAVETIGDIGKFLWKYKEEIIAFAKVFATLWGVEKLNKFGQGIVNVIGQVSGGVKTLASKVGGLTGFLGKLGLAAGVAFAGWQIGTLINDVTGLSKATAQLHEWEVKLEYDRSARKTGLTQVSTANAEYNRQIREIGQSLGENTNSVRLNAIQILNNKEAYSKLTPEVQALIRQYALSYEKSQEYSKAQREAALAAQEAKKREEALRIAKEEAQKAQELQNKKVQEFADKLKLTTDFQAEIEEKTRLLTSAIKLAGPEWNKNSQAVEEVSKYIKELRDQYSGANVEIPDALKKIETAIKLTKAEEEAWNATGKESDNTFKAVAGSLDTGVLSVKDFQENTDHAKQSIESAAEMTQTWSYKIDVLSGSMQSVGKNILEAADALSYMGIIGEKTADGLNLLGGGLGEAGKGLEDLMFNSKSIFDYFTNGLSVITGAYSVVSGIIDLLSGKSGEMEAAERRLAGITGLSEDWAEQIEKIAQELGGAESAGRAFNSVLPDIIQNADRTAANFSTLITKTREIVSVFERGNASAQETAANYGAAFSEMINFAQELGMEGGESITGLIMLADEFGLKVKEVEEYVQTNMKNAFEGYKKYIAGEFSSVTIGVFEDMRVLQDKISNNQKLVDGVKGLGDSWIGLSNVIRLSDQQYQDFETSAVDAYNALINQGFSSKEALQVMQPQIERLAFLQQQFGYNVDDATQALINQGVESGLISADMKTENQLMIDGMDRIVDRLDMIAVGLGVKIPDALGSMENASNKTLDSISRNTGKWSGQLDTIYSQFGSIQNASLSLNRTYDDIMVGHSLIPLTGEWLDKLGTVDSSMYTIGDSMKVLDNEYSVLMQSMGDETRRFAIDSQGVIRPLLNQLALIGKQTSSTIGSKYGVYTDSEKQEMTAEFFQLSHLWKDSRATIVKSEESMRRFLQDVEGLEVIDESKDIYNRFVTSMRQWYGHVKNGDTWNEDSLSWTKPDVKAASGFQTLLERPTSIFLQGKHILAGEAGPELFSITPLQGVPVPVSRKSGTDLPPLPYPSKTGSDSKPQKKEITVTVKIEGKIEGAYPPIVIQTRQDGSINKEQLRYSIGEMVEDNHRGLVDKIAKKVADKIKKEL